MTDHKALENVLLGVAYLHPMKILHVIKNFRSNHIPTTYLLQEGGRVSICWLRMTHPKLRPSHDDL